MAAFVERARCPVCDSGALTTLRSVDFAHPSVWTFVEQRYQGRVRRRELAGRPHEVARCSICHLSFHRYVLSEGSLERLYEEWLPATAPAETRSTDLSDLERHSRSEPGRTRVLDLAAGTGEWSLAARGRGFDVVAVERSDARRKHLNELGLDCFESLDEIGRASVDYAHCDRIFEHLLRPVETLRSVYETLAPRGIARIRVPDASRAAKEIAASYWTASDDALRPLEHVNGFTARALRVLGREAGFGEVERPRRFAFGRSSGEPVAITLARPRS